MRHCTHRDCASPMPPNARFCPRCGRRRSTGNRAIAFAFFLFAVVGLLALFALARVRESPAARVDPIETAESHDAAPNPWPNDSRISHR